MVSNTGVDPQGSYKCFLRKDPSTNVDVHRDRKRHEPIPEYVPHGQVPAGTTKCTYKLGLGTDAKLRRDPARFSPAAFPRNPTDVVSSEPPPIQRPFQGLFDKMVSTAKYEKNVASTNPWVPLRSATVSLSNQGSVAHNIINHQENAHFWARESDAAHYGRRKGVAEFADLKHPYAANTNKDHVKALAQDAGVFKRKEGVFTNLYTSAARFGEVAFKT